MTEAEFLTLRPGTVVWTNFGNEAYFGAPRKLEVHSIWVVEGVTWVGWQDNKGRSPKYNVLQFGCLQEPKKEEPMPDETTRKTVDQYQIVLVERGGFTFVGLDILTSDQQTAHFEFHPAFAHALSDELLKSAAHAAPKAAKE